MFHGYIAVISITYRFVEQQKSLLLVLPINVPRSLTYCYPLLSVT